ncbi:hypothetical protein GF380_00785 [Candidatus Uhrbacteria bacterium]|nr:hypothetical protein [Candidatus Uhrbacteria bacterium]MBD3283893.1 hypothetical protein [Candidatus Uhrbacteria bacterium]
MCYPRVVLFLSQVRYTLQQFGKETLQNVATHYGINPRIAQRFAHVPGENVRDFLFLLISLYGLSRSEAVGILHRRPSCITCTDYVTMDRMHALMDRAFTYSEIGKLIKRFPAILGLEHETIASNYDYFETVSRLKPREVKQSVLTWPAILGYSHDRIREQLQIFDRIGVEYVDHAARFTLSLPVIRGRIVVLQARGQNLRRDQTDLFVSTEIFRQNTRCSKAAVIQRDPGQMAILQML